MDKLQEELDNWAIQELSCSPVYDGDADVIVGWTCHIINRGWYDGGWRPTLEEAIRSAITAMEHNEDRWKD